MEILLFILAIISIGFLIYDKFNIQKKFTLFLALSFMIFWGILIGCINILKGGTWSIYIVSLVWLFYCIVWKSDQIKKYVFSLPVVIFIFSSFVFFIVYTFKAPFFCAWDEFSHWGIYLKNVKNTHQLHVYSEYNFVHPTYPQAMTVLYYVGSFFNKTYSESSVLLIYSIFIHACVSVLVPDIEIGDKTGESQKLRVLFALFVPFACFMFPYIGYAAPYVSAYLDVIMGVFFGTSMLYIFETQIQDTKFSGFLAIILFVLLQIKDIGITFYLICVATYLIEIFVFIWDNKKEKIKFSVQFLICGLLIPLAGKRLWGYVVDITGNNKDQFANSNFNSFVEVIQDQLTGINNYFAEISDAYWYGIKNVNVMWTGIPILVIAVMLIIVGFMLSYLYAKGGKKYVYIYPICSIGYFMCYLLVLLAIYLCGMSKTEALSNASMDRYVGSFLNGWSFILCGITFKYLYNSSKKILQYILIIAVAFIYISFAFCDIPYIQTDKEDAGYVFFENHGENILNNVEAGETVWLKSDEENLYQKYIMAYEMYPIELAKDLDMDFSKYDIQEAIDIMEEKQIQYMYILNGEEEFMENNSNYIDNVYDAKSSGALLRLNDDNLELIY